MRSLSQAIMDKVRKGTWQYAVLEDLKVGLATIRLGKKGNGPRMTNLNIIGNPEVGDVVIVDYSTSRPYVRHIYTEPVVLLDEMPFPEEGTEGIALPPKGDVEVSSHTGQKLEKFKNPCEGVMAVILFLD